MDDALTTLLSIIETLPEPVRARTQKEIEQLLGMLRDRRSPRVMLLGRRGAGKSGLTNAIFGARVRGLGAVRTQTGRAEWEVCNFAGREMEILDTRGVQEASQPAEYDSERSAEGSLISAVRERCPDVILFLVKAKEVDAAITGDLAALERVHREAFQVHGTEVKIVPVLSQCDELDPSYLKSPPYDSKKLTYVREASAVFAEHLAENSYLARFIACDVVPTSALADFDEKKRILPERDYRWNIELLALRMQEVLPDVTQLAFVRAAQFRKIQKRVARKIVVVTAAICLGVGAQPIPLADMPFITSLQVFMVMIISYISGRPVTVELARELSVGLGLNVGAGVVFRELARALLKLIPGPGNFASGAMAAAGTKAIGEAAIIYFIDRKGMEAARRRFEEEGLAQ
ncbi:50S ribosome-binding GTPase (plasmid) [Streptomyces sp. Qhu-G9]|uniref:GTPase n=1 Tax=Streptomyces sp. Qhu-G9 TaxID=3452799 RepID=UPI0022ABF976|nr:GTPase [Streptomyces aurantiacus]WAU78443.1 50S ribosome-binding GTPase [Streptomyces aurantiacus]